MMRLSVLFANDDVLTQWVMTEVLLGAGFAVSSACRASEVLDLISGCDDFDILLADATVIDTAAGASIRSSWRKAQPGRPMIYTGASRSGIVQPLQFHETFLQTPFSARAMLQAVDSALEAASFHLMMPPGASGFHHVH